jgi:hypothetical protein
MKKKLHGSDFKTSSYIRMLSGNLKAFVVILLLCAISVKTLGQSVVIWSEDFEEAGNDTYTSNQATIPGFTNQWEYNKDNNGRLRLAAGFNHGGNNAATLDANPTNNYSQNYIIATIDISGYHDNLNLSFYFMHHGEEDHNTDRVWMRSGSGGSYGGWTEIYNLSTNKGAAGSWVNASGIDVTAQLQPTDTEIQVRFGQYDNYAANNTTSDDGFTFDDIALIYTPDPVAGDYRTRRSANWTSNNTWQIFNGTSWQNTNNDPGENSDAGTVYILPGHTITLNTDRPSGANSITNLSVEGTLNFGNNTTTRSLVVDGNVTGTGTISMTRNSNPHNLTAGGDFTISTLNPGQANVFLNGNNPSVIGGTAALQFYNLTINKNAGATTVTNSSMAFSVGNDLQITRGDLVLEATDANYTVSNDLTVAGNGTLTHSVNWNTAGKFLGIGGDLNIGGVYDFSDVPRSHIQMSGAGTKTINTGTTTLSILTLQNGDYFANGTVSLDDNFWAMFGTTGSFHTNGQTVTANASVLINGGTVFIDGGTLNVTGGLNVGIGGLNGSVNFTSGSLNTDNVNLGDGTRTGILAQSGGTINISGDILINPSCSYALSNSPQINISGDFTNNGTYAKAGETVTFNGSGSQTITNAPGGVFNNLVFDNAAGFVAIGDITVTGALTMIEGNIDMGSNMLTLGDASTNVGVFNYTSGTIIGQFERWIANASTGTFSFPVGTGSNKNTAIISLNSGTSGGSLIVEFIPSDPGSSGLPLTDGSLSVSTAFSDGYWALATANGFSNNDFDLLLDGTGMISNTIDVNTTVLTRATPGNDWTTEGTHLPAADPIIYRIEMTTLPAEIGLGVGAPLGAGVAWYTYGGGGDWTDPTTWTQDGSGSTLIPAVGGVPTGLDNVVILSGATVFMDINNVTVASLELSGELVLGTSSGHDFTIIYGNGKMFLDGSAGLDNFPDGVVSLFADPVLGGTVEYNGNGNGTGTLTLDTQREFNHFILNLDQSTDELVLLNDLAINGNFTLTQGDFQINDNTSTTIINLAVNGDALVDSNASLTVGQGNTIGSYTIQGGTMPGVGNYHNIFHQITFANDFTNNGTVRFTNQTAPVYNEFTSTGAATVRFTGASNNTVSLFGTTDFYNLVVNKGNDQTYILEINSDNTSNFALYGPNSVGRVEDSPYSSANPEVRKALWIFNGTLHLTGNISIPTLSEGNNITGNGDYPIGQNAALWMDGANITVYTTADDASQVPAGASGVNTGSSNQALSLYGTFRITNGFFGTRASGGFIFWNAAAGNILVEGGTVNVSQLRSAGGGTGTNSYIQTGGTVVVRGSSGQSGEVDNGYALFSMHLQDGVFAMSGGTLRVYGQQSGGTVFINSADGYYSISGGDLIVENTTDANAEIASTTPFWNVTLEKNGGTATEIELIDNTVQGQTIMNPDLIVLNNLTIKNGVTFDHNGNDVEIGSDFVIENGGAYLYDAGKPNTLTMNGIDNAIMGLYNIDGGGDPADQQVFHNLIINKPHGKTITLESGKTGSNLLGWQNNLFRVNGDAFKVLSGTLDQGVHSILANCDTVVNYDILTVFDVAGAATDANPNGENDQLKFASNQGTPTDIVLITSDTSVIGNLKYYMQTNIVTLNSDLHIQYLEFSNGRLDIRDKNLTIDYWDETKDFVSGSPSVNHMIVADGQASDGGLSLYIDSERSYTYFFGMGLTGAEPTSKYTPATVTVSNFTDDGYITIRPVDKVLATTKPNMDVLSYYWKVDHTGFTPGSEPDVTYQFTYIDADTDGGNEASYVPGKVLDDDPFTRSSEVASNINTSTNVITFNGDLGGGGTPFMLELANYTAGDPDRFTGTVEVYYTKRLGDAAGMNWRTLENWTPGTDPGYARHDSRQPTATDYPKAGDVAYVGWVPDGDPAYTDGKPHGIEIDGTEQLAELRFTQMTDMSGNPVARDYAYNFQFRPTVCINPGGLMLAGAVSGEGAFWLRSEGGNQVDPDFSSVDMGAFAKEDSAYMIYESTSNAFVYDNIPQEVPNLLISGDGWGGSDRNFKISTDVIVKEDFELLGDVNLILSSGATGDFLVEGDLRIFRLDINGNDSGGNGEIAFPNDASRTIEVLGDLQLVNQNALINIRNADNSPVNTSDLIVHGDIFQDNNGGGGMQLSSGTNLDYIHLTLTGTGNHEFNIASGSDASLYSMTVDKGSDQNSSFSFNGNFTLDGPTSGVGVDKALTLLNGIAVMNNSSIDIDLTTGDDDFSIPVSAGLQVSQGQVNVSGNDTGIELDGSLIIDGGTVDMDGTGNGNNYIEYTASGSALIDISAGALVVGSQIRGNLITTTSVLNYTQTGGTVIVGKNAAPEASRSVLEIHNTGSSFTYTGGSLTIVRQNTASPAVAALRLQPTFYDVTQTIVIGSGDTPAGQTDLGINSNIPLAGLTITGSANYPTAVIKVNPLNLTNTLTIDAGATLDGNGIELTMEGDFVNNGIYTPNANQTTFSSSGSQQISGSGTTGFYDFVKSGTGTLNTSISFTIDNDLTISEGIFDDNSHTIALLGNATIDGAHQSTGGAGNGLEFSGATQQLLSRSGSGISSLGIITLQNPNGVVIPEDMGYNFDIEGGLNMNGGIFNIGSSAVTLGENALISTSTSFSVSNMIKTNSSFTDNGLGKTFPLGYSGVFVYPIGEVKYTPVTMDFTGGTSGSSVGTIAVRPANEYHPTVNDGVQGMPTQPDINNVLQYYWTLRASNFNGFSADVTFQYDETEVSVTEGGFSESDYIPARILAFDNPTNLVNKYDVADVDDSANEILFSASSVFTGVNANGISGDYFAGIDEAIPDNVATYTVDVDGGSVSGDSYDEDVPGGGAPSGAVIIIPSGFTLDFNVDNVQLYKTEIRDGGTLQISNTEFHRLGIVEGIGTLKIVHNDPGNPSLPAGDYGTFFSCSGGGLEYAGTGSYNILGGIPNIRNLTLSGSGNRNFPNNDVTVCEDLIADGPDIFGAVGRRIDVDGDLYVQSGSLNAPSADVFDLAGDGFLYGGQINGNSSGSVNIYGSLLIDGGDLNVGSSSYVFSLFSDFTFLNGTFNGGTGNSRVEFGNDATSQTPSTISGNLTGSNAFKNLYVNKTLSNKIVNLNGDIQIDKQLVLTDGIVNTNGNSVILGSVASVTPDGGQANSYVNGRVVKTLSTAGDDFLFPIGGADRYRPAYLLDVSVGALDWEAEYYQASPVTDTDVSNLTSSDAAILTMSSEEYWRITDGQSPGSATATVGLSWGSDSYVSSNSSEREQLRVMVWNETNSNWDNAGGANYSGSHTDAFGMFNTLGTVTFSEKIFTLGSTDLSNPLPVELVSFIGKEKEGKIILNWETASEQNNDYFLVEHSVDGITFKEIARVTGGGTINITQYYSYTHRLPSYPDNYYRLKQVDFDGAFEYSDAILIRLNKELAPDGIDFVMYPNPTTTNSVNIRLNSVDFSRPLGIQVVNLNGRLIYQKMIDSVDFNSDINLDFGYGMTRGIYLVRLVQSGNTTVRKLVLK